jgi:high affinity sulfate transporter 1
VEPAEPDVLRAATGPVLGRSGERPVRTWIPGAAMLRTYRRSWFRSDLVAGLVLTAVLVPAGMGYAEAAGLPPIHGLYATIVPLLAYAIFGPSRILVLGPDSSLAPLIAAAVLPLAAADESRAVALAATLGVLVGLLCIALGLARFGFITDLLSMPIRYGYINGIALTVLVGQLPKLFGFSTDGSGFLSESTAFASGVRDGKTEPVALTIGLICLLIILGVRRWRPRVPGVLIAVVLATIAVGAWGLADRLSVVGVLPQGLPSFELPDVRASDVASLVAAAVGIALVSFADTSVLSRTFAIRGGYEVDANQEMVAVGAANLAAGVFQGFPISSSSSRTPVAESAGASTQMTGVVGAVAIALMLLFAPGVVRNLPSTALAAVVISAAIGLFEVAGVRRLYRIRRSEFALSMAAFLAVTLLGVLWGIAVAVALSLLNFIRRAMRPYDALLGRPPGVEGYHDVSRYPDARQIPGLVLFRWDAPLFFANADLFRERVTRLVAEQVPPTRWVVVAAEPITDVDTTAADMLEGLRHDLEEAGVGLAFAEMKDPVRDKLARYGQISQMGTDAFFPTIEAAVRAYDARP